MTSKKTSPAESPMDRNEAKNRGWPKGKRRYPKGMGAPKQPLSGYVHFLNERRDSVRAENPEITFSDLSKKMAAEWSAKSDEEKHKYNEMAKKDKDRYDKEFAEYQQTDAYKHYLESQFSSDSGSAPSHKKKKPALGGTTGPREDSELETTRDQGPQLTIPSSLTAATSTTTTNIPIFTEEFLEHNRMREHELRQLKKQMGEFEEQNAVLSKHIDSIKSAIGKLEMETVQQRQNNASLQQHLESIRQLVVSSFRGVQLPASAGGGDEPPLSLATVDQFVARLLAIATENPGQHQALINTARDIVSRMDYAKIAC